MVEISNKQLAYGSLVIGLFATLVAIASGGGIFTMLGAAIAGMSTLAAILFLKYGYLIVPLFTQKGNILMVTDTGYEIPPSQDVVVKKAPTGLFYASAFLVMKIYESMLEKSEEEVMSYSKFFERAISNIKYVTKVSYLLYAEDISEKRKILETKKAEAQLRLAREREKAEPDVLKIDRYEREVAMWAAQLDSLTKGVKPMGVVAYVMTTASGITKEEAITKVKAQASELKATLSNALNVEVEPLTADEMLRVVEWERTLPTTPEELENQVI
ncbi:MAG: hypothetical protein ACPL06_03305 [Candidatus Anstonellales archaeon]